MAGAGDRILDITVGFDMFTYIGTVDSSVRVAWYSIPVVGFGIT